MHGVETMAYVEEGGAPWHLGIAGGTTEKQVKALKAAPSWEEMIVAAGSNWEVEIGPVYGPDKKLIPGRWVVYRKTDGHVLSGMVSKRYTPLQNVDAFKWIDSLVADRTIRFETAGVLFGGRIIWALARLDKDMKIAGEEYRNYLLFSTGHDCVTAARIKYVSERVVCYNTLQAAHGETGREVFIAHNPQIMNKLAAARDVFKVTLDEEARMKAWLERAVDVKIGDKTIAAVEDRLFGPLDDATPAQRRNAIEKFREIYAEEKVLNGETAYTMINAITGYADHAKRYTGESDARAEKRFASVLNDGSAARFKSTGIKVLEDEHPKLAKV